MTQNNDVRIGVYICHCGSNIAGVIDVKDVVEYAKTLPNVVSAKDYIYMCSAPGQNMLKDDIKQLGLNRVVIASCSPTLHEHTFRLACQDAGLNPYLYEQANIREHCTWVTEDHAKATEKSKALVSAAVRRVLHQEPLLVKEAPLNPNVLVVGGGIAGIRAALEIADSGNDVYLVEREPSVGGHMAQFDKTFPTLDCASCIFTPLLSAIGQHPHVKLLTYSEVEEVSGFVGNFNVKVKRKPRYVDETKCTGCGICQQKCPFKTDSEFDLGLAKRKAIYTPFLQAVPNVPVIDTKICAYFKTGKCRACEKFCEVKAIDFEQKAQTVDINVGAIIMATGYDVFDPTVMTQYGYGKFPNVFTALQFERMCNASGPTKGQILLKDGSSPKSVAIVHCVGSRDKNYHSYCSRVCCMYSLKYSHLIREKVTGEPEVFQFYIDMRCFGKGYEEFYERLGREEVNFIRGKVAQVTDRAISDEEKGKLIVVAEDSLLGSLIRVPVDMVVLSTALEPRADAEATARMFSVSRSADGFFLERHPKLDPVATTTEGVYVVGCCQGPKDIPDTVAQASAAAARVLAMISKGKVELEAAIANINEEYCSGCRMCELVCPFKAIAYNEEREVCQVNEALCKGCGTCAGTCPSGAVTGKHFTVKQIMAEIEGVLV